MKKTAYLQRPSVQSNHSKKLMFLGLAPITAVALLVVLFGQMSALPQAAPDAATIRYVTTTGSGTACDEGTPCSIQEAFVQSINGDEIRVAAGTYVVNLNITQSVTLTGGYEDNNWAVGSLPSINLTTLDGNGTGSVIQITGVASPTIEGFIIQNGNSNSIGGGIFSNGSGATIRNNIIRNNADGGIFDDQGAWIANNEIYLNTARGIIVANSGANNTTHILFNKIYSNTENSTGAGVFVSANGQAFIEGNYIYENSSNFVGGGIGIDQNGFATIQNNMIHNNNASIEGGGIYVAEAANIWHNTIVDNVATSGGGGGIMANGATVNISNTIIVSNTGATPTGIKQSASTITGGNNNIFNNDLSGGISLTPTISSDPQFSNYINNNYHLHTTSPNIDKGENLAEVIQDIDGEARPNNVGWDIGADEHYPDVPKFEIGPHFDQFFEPRNTTANYTVYLTNTGNIEDDYNILCSIEDSINWATRCTSTISNLPDGNSAVITVEVDVPNLPALTVADTYITVTSGLSPTTLIEYARMRTIINPNPGVQFTPNYSTTLLPGETFTFTHRITNTGDAIDTFDIFVTDNDPEWDVEILPSEPHSVTLGAGASTNVQVQIKVPDYAATSYTNTTTIQAASQFDPSVFAEVEDTITPKPAVGTRYVGVDGNDTNNNCTTSIRPCGTVRHALGQASTGDEIRLRGNGSVYYEQGLNINDTVYLSGGWNSNFTEQDEDNITVIDADLPASPDENLIFQIAPGNFIRPSISNVTLRNGRGGSQGGAVNVGDNAQPTFNDVVFEQNSAGSGGAIFIGSGALVQITKGQFFSNTATSSGGGAIYNESSQLYLNQSQFINNHANGGNGGGLAMNGGQLIGANNLFAQGTAAVNGAGLYSNNGRIILYHQTFADNEATGSGGAIYNATAEIDLVNSIIVSNTAATGPAITNNSGSVTVDYSNVYGHEVPEFSGTIANTAGFSVDPNFADAVYRLALGSPMIDVGNPGTPIDNDVNIGVDFEDDFRPTDQGYDIGYDEIVGCLAKRDNTIYGSIQDAIDAPSPVSDLIMVSGICRGVNTIDHNGETLSQTVHITETVTIQGGWNGDFSQQTFEPTYIDPQGRGRGIFVTGDIEPVIENIIILNGDANGLMGGPNDEDAGGGIYNDNARPTFTAVSVASSTAQIGGAIFNNEGHATYQPLFPTIGEIEFIRGQVTTNTATIAGAGVYAYSGTLTIDGVEFLSNTAPNGAGIYNENAVVTATNNILANNSGTDGAGLYNTSPLATNVLHNTFYNNTATNEGGGVHNNGGVLTVASNIFDSNQANSAPALFASGGTVTADYNYYYGPDPQVVGPSAGSNSISSTIDEPGLTDPNNGNFSLLEDARAVDKGDPNSPINHDYENDPRPSDQGPDMGADETVGCLVRINEAQSPIYGSIQAAMEVANEGDVLDVAGICKGVHEFDTGTLSGATDDCSTADGIIDVNLHVDKNVILRGGWREDFSVQDEITVLDAEGNGRVVYFSPNITATLDNFHIIRGTADNGAGICIDQNASPQILNNHIISNTATANGGGIYSFNSTATIDKGNRIYENNATNGAGIAIFAGSPTTIATIQNNFIYHNNASSNGGAVFNDGGNNLVWHNTIVENDAFTGGAIFVNNNDPDIRGNLIINNTATNTGGIYALTGNSPIVDYNDFYQNSNGDVNSIIGDIGANSVISDPLFATDQYTITYSSPIVDISDPTITLNHDFEDDIRPSHQGMDMGADEVGGCYARNTADPSTVFGSVQQVVDLAIAGDTIEFDGECLGVNTLNNTKQNLYLDKSLTIDGNNWNFDTKSPLTATLNAYNLGRVVYVDSSATVTLTRMILQNGEAVGAGDGDHGGGIYNAGTLVLDQVYLNNNNATHGGAVYNASTLTMQAGFVGPNNTAVNGAGVYNNATSGRADIIGQNIISGNLAFGSGGALFQNQGELMLDGNKIYVNATQLDGTIYLGGSDQIDVRNNFIYNNEATNGAGVYNNTDANIWHNTIYNNDAANQGGGIYSTDANVNIDSNIIDNNSPSGLHVPGGTTVLFNNIINNFPNQVDGGLGALDPSNISANPDYRAPGIGDFHLDSGSPGEDEANPDLVGIPNDIDGDIRPTNGGPDIGADEINTCLVRVFDSSKGEYNYYGVLQDAINFAEDVASDLPTIEIARGECRGVVDDDGVATQQVAHVTEDLHFIGSLVRANFTDQNDVANPVIGNYTSILNAEGEGRVIYITNNAKPSFEQLVLVHGNANTGGAVYNPGAGEFNFTSGYICESSATDGGAYYGGPGSIAYISGVRIGYCWAAQVIENADGSVTEGNVTYPSFDGNSATNQGGGVWSSGRFDIFNTSFYENSAGTNGAGIYNSGNDNRVINGTFYLNESGSTGGGVYNTGSNLGLYHNTYQHNTAVTGSGAAIFSNDASMTLNSSVVYSNTNQAGTGTVFDTPNDNNVAYNNFSLNFPAMVVDDTGANANLEDARLSVTRLTRFSPAIDKADPSLVTPGPGVPGTFPFGFTNVDEDRFGTTRPDGNPNHIALKQSDMGSNEWIKEFGCAIEFIPLLDPINVGEAQANPGEEVVYNFQLVNTGQNYPYDPLYHHGFTDTITMTLVDSSESWSPVLAGGDVQVFTMGWEERISGVLTVTVPSDATSGVQDTTTIQCQSGSRPQATGIGQARTNVGLASGLNIEPPHIRAAQPGDVFTLIHRVHNTGNKDVRVTITPNAGAQHASVERVDSNGNITDTIVTIGQRSFITTYLRVTILDTAAVGELATPGMVAREVDNNDQPVTPPNHDSILNEITILPAPGTRHVAATSSSDIGNNCTDPAQPCATIQHAIDQAMDGDDILIAAGTYTDTVTQTIGADTYTQNVYINKSVNLQGGYNAVDGFVTYQPITNATYINGLGNNRAIFITNSHTVTISSLFIHNGLADGSDPAGSVGGGIYNAGSDLTITGTWVLTNDAQFAGGLYHEAGDLIVNSSVFAGNSNDANPVDFGEGGAIYVVTGTAHIENNTFVNNSVTEFGVTRPGPTAVLDIPSGNDGFGGAIYVEGGAIKALNNIFSENQGFEGSAVYIKAGVAITNDYNLFWTSSPPTQFLSTNITTGTNSLVADPLFTDAYYHIDTLSPAKDAGTSTGLTVLDVDFDLDSRPSGIGVDIGADERLQFPSFEFSPTPLSATINTGEVYTYTHWLTTTGDVTDSYTMTLQHETIGTGFTYALSPTTILDLATGESVKVTLVVTGGIPGGYDLTTITATSATSLTQIVTDTTIVSQTAGVDIEASENGLGLPAQTISYSHTLTNTGDGIDEFELSILSETPSGWNVTLTPTQTGILTINESIPFTVTVDVPAGTLSDTVHVVEVIANAYDPDASDILTDTTTVGPSYGLSLTPDRSSNVSDGVTAVYTHTLQNTGNLTDTINLSSLSTPNWLVDIEPTSVTLDPLETQEIVVSVTVPANTGGLVHTALITATSQGGMTATAVNTTTVNEDRSVILSPANSVITEDAGETVTHTHTLTNTGNITDTYWITPTSSLGWLNTHTLGPITLGPDMTATVTTSISIPLGAFPPAQDRTTITATSQTDALVYDVSVDDTIVSIQRGLVFVPDNDDTSPAPNIMTYTHYLTNTGNAEDTFTLSANSNRLWTVETFPVSPITLQRDEGTTVVVSVTVPPGAINDMVDETTITAISSNPSYFATVTDTTTISGTAGTLSVTIAPDNVDFGLPGETVEYQHTVTNIGTVTATFSITAVSSNGWNINIPIDNVLLNPLQSQEISITIDIPLGTLSDTVDTITVTAYADADQATFDTATDITTVSQDSAVIIEPDNTQSTDPTTTITYQHTITNNGNGTDTFVLTAATLLNWPVQVNPPVTIGAGLTSTVLVTLTVPVGTDGLVEPMIVTATSSFDPSLFDTAVNTTTVNVIGPPPTRGVIIAPDLADSGDPGDTIEYTHVITNLGNVTEQFSINAVPSNPAWIVTYLPTNVTLNAMQSTNLTVRVTIPLTASGGDTMQTTITALSPAGTTDSALNTTTVGLQQQSVYLPVVLNNYSSPVDPTPTPIPTATATSVPCTPTGVDLVVTSIQVQPANPTSGQPATVLVTIRNQGTINVTYGNNFFVDFYVNRIPGYAISGDLSWGVQGSTLTAGASQTFSAPYTFTGGTHQLYAQVDTDNTVNECPNDNNNILGPIPLTVSGARANDEDNNAQSGTTSNTEPRHTPTPNAPVEANEEEAEPVETETPLPMYTPTVTGTPHP